MTLIPLDMFIVISVNTSTNTNTKPLCNVPISPSQKKRLKLESCKEMVWCGVCTN